MSGSLALGAPRCPFCGSDHLEVLHLGRKAGCALGSIAGALAGWGATEIGASLGGKAGAVGAVAGVGVGILLAGMLGAVAGGTAGAQLGHLLDENLLPNRRCLACGYHCSAYEPWEKA